MSAAITYLEGDDLTPVAMGRRARFARPLGPWPGLMDLMARGGRRLGVFIAEAVGAKADTSRAADPVDAVSESSDEPVQEAALSILAAEDNHTNQLVLNALLESLGADLTMTANGREAVQAFAERRFDLILMDIQMPEMNGIEATGEIRRREREDGRARTPILAVTANVMLDQVDAYMAAGMDGVVAKPIQMSALFHAINHALGGGDPAAGMESLRAV
jgi:CheY-like chemotaxis protein